MRALPTKYDVVAVRINAPMTISVVLSGVSGLVVFCVCAVDAGPSRVCGFHAVRLSVHVDVERCGSPVGTILKDTTRTPARTRPTATAPGELTTRSTLRLAVFPAGQFTGRDARGQQSGEHCFEAEGAALRVFPLCQRPARRSPSRNQ